MEKNESKNSIMLEQFKNSIKKSYKEAKSIPLTYIYITTQFLGLVQALQYNVAWLN